MIFDCDGVLVDSEEAHASATVDELRSRGLELPAGFLAQHVGRRVEDQMRIVSQLYGLDFHDLHRSRESRFWSSMSDVVPVPGSAACVRTAQEAGLPVAVATSGSRRWISHVLRRLDLDRVVSHVVSGDDVTNPKPHPEPYRRASDLLGVPADRCAVVEDSLLGYQSADGAGCSVIVLSRRQRPVAADLFPDAREVVTSMEGVARALGLTLTDAGSDESPDGGVAG